ncbi:MAG TPA: hypothetical protein DIU18_02445, partial [Gemmatimonadetes bacterium]|nr:hypothetical protein [Gemmatimonadota bacterium]
MLSSLRGRLALILVVVAISGWQLYSDGLKQGLDLQGGMHLVLEVDDPDSTLTTEARADAIDRAERIIRTRVDELGVEEPLIQKVGSERLIVELAGIRDEERAKSILNEAAFLEFKLVLPTTEVEPTLSRLDRAIVATLSEDEIARLGQRAAPVTPGQRTIEDLLFTGGDTSRPADSAATQAEDTVSTRPTARPFTALLNTGDVEGSYLVATEDVESIQSFLALGEVQRALPRDVSLTFETQPVGVGVRTYRRLYVLEKDAFMTGEALQSAIAGRDPQFNQSQVQFELNRAG